MCETLKHPSTDTQGQQKIGTDAEERNEDKRWDSRSSGIMIKPRDVVSLFKCGRKNSGGDSISLISLTPSIKVSLQKRSMDNAYNIK
jgi:hypothetical protein